MPKSHAEELRILSRRSKVARMLLTGITNQFEITAALGMDVSQRTTISRDVTAIKAEWRESAIRDFNEAKGRELEKLEVLEREYWEAWERSKAPKHTLRFRRRNAEEEDSESEIRKEPRDGNPAFLDGVLRCIQKRCDILSIDATGKVGQGQVGDNYFAQYNFDGMSVGDVQSLHDSLARIIPQIAFQPEADTSSDDGE